MSQRSGDRDDQNEVHEVPFLVESREEVGEPDMEAGTDHVGSMQIDITVAR